jgi:hypothetical protein
VNPIKVQTTVDEATAAAIPAFRPLLGKRVELIAVELAWVLRVAAKFDRGAIAAALESLSDASVAVRLP